MNCEICGDRLDTFSTLSGLSVCTECRITPLRSPARQEVLLRKMRVTKQQVLDYLRVHGRSYYSDICRGLGIPHYGHKEEEFLVWNALNGQSLGDPHGGLVWEGTVIREDTSKDRPTYMLREGLEKR